MKKIKIFLPIMALLWPGTAWALEMETQLYQSCTNRLEQSDAILCSCKAEKWASQRVQSVDNPSTYFRVSDRLIHRLQHQWYTPELTQRTQLNGDEAIMAMLSLHIRQSCTES